MKCKGCGHKILDYHEMIIDIQPFEYPELDDKAKDDLLRERILHKMIISKESE